MSKACQLKYSSYKTSDLLKLLRRTAQWFTSKKYMQTGKQRTVYAFLSYGKLGKFAANRRCMTRTCPLLKGTPMIPNSSLWTLRWKRAATLWKCRNKRPHAFIAMFSCGVASIRPWLYYYRRQQQLQQQQSHPEEITRTWFNLLGARNLGF